MLWGLVTSSAAPEMVMLRTKQLIELAANLIAPDINTVLREVARRPMNFDTSEFLEIDKGVRGGDAMALGPRQLSVNCSESRSQFIGSGS